MPKLFFLWTVWLVCIYHASHSGVTALPIGGMIESSNYDNLGSLVREYFKIMEKVRNQPRIISGQVNLRAPRSELGDMAHAFKLYQLQELDRTLGSRSRPRFGKRNEVVGENDVPGYGQTYDNANAQLGGPDDQEQPRERR